MSRLRKTRSAERAAGFTLVEMMVALAIASVVMVVLMTVMLSASRTGHLTAGLSTLQENARFALSTIARDVRVAGGQFCLNFNGRGSIASSAQVQASEPVRGIWAAFDATAAPWRLGAGPMATAYWTEPSSLVRGFDCSANPSGAGVCAPAVSASYPAFIDQPLPAVGVGAGMRARGSDVLFVRSLAGEGVRLTGIANAAGDGNAATLQLESDASVLGLAGPGAVLVSDCSFAAAIKVQPAGSVLTLGGNFNDDVLPAFEVERQARVFHLPADLVGVIYFVAMRELPANDAQTGRMVSSLIRRSGGTDMIVADGVERFDLLYHVELRDGRVAVLDAAQVEALPAGACRDWSSPIDEVTSASACGWRSLIGVETHLLVNTVDAIDSVAESEAFRYSWLNDGSDNTGGVYEDPSQFASLANGLPPGRMLRREFQTFVAIRGYNP